MACKRIHSLSGCYLLLVLATGFGLLPRHSLAAKPVTVDEVLKRIAENDARLDQILIELDVTEYHLNQRKGKVRYGPPELKIDESVDRTGIPTDAELMEWVDEYSQAKSPEAIEAVPEQNRKWVEAIRNGKITCILPKHQKPPRGPSRVHDFVCIRWPDVAFASSMGKNEVRYGTIGSRPYSLERLSTREDSEWFCTESQSKNFPNGTHGGAISTLFALGVGYHKYIRNVTRFDASGDSYQLEFDFDYWGQVLDKGILQFDDALIVRSADLRFGTNHYQIITSGDYQVEENRFRCARQSSFFGDRFERPDIQFDLQLRSIQLGVSDATFAALANTASPLTEARWEVKPGGVKKARGSLRHSDDQSWLLLTPIGLFGASAIVAFVFVRRAQNRRTDGRSSSV